jgi:hypothetical protein
MLMNKRLLLGLWRALLPIPRAIWQKEVAKSEQSGKTRLSFMTDDHHRVRDFAVMELPRHGAPLPPELIAERLNLDVNRVKIILDELEKHMTFVFRNEQGAVTWAYPVTVDRTPHRVKFSTGEQIYAA